MTPRQNKTAGSWPAVLIAMKEELDPRLCGDDTATAAITADLQSSTRH